MRRTDNDHRIGVGASSVLMILAVLAMTALGLLALGSARQTRAQTQRNLQTTLSYYEAAGEAQRRMMLIDQAAADCRAQGREPDAAWFQSYDTGADFHEEDGTLAFAFTLPAGDARELRVSGTVSAAGGARYTVAEHALVSVYEDEGGQVLDLIGE